MLIKYFILFFIVQSVFCYATAQAPDYIIYNGEKRSLIVNPMEEYFDEYPEKRPIMPNTALWRGYIATFEIKQNELFVIRIDSEGKNMIKDCFNGLDKVKVDWYNGLLVLPYGKIMEYIHLGYASVYENYILIEIKNGNFIQEYNINSKQYRIFRNALFELWKKTEKYEDLSIKYGFELEIAKEYDEILLELLDESIPNELIEYIIRDYEIIKKMTPPIIQLVPDNIENYTSSYLSSNIHYIIIAGIIGIIVGIICIIIKYKNI